MICLVTVVIGDADNRFGVTGDSYLLLILCLLSDTEE